MYMHTHAITINKRGYEFERPLEGRGIEVLEGGKKSEKCN